MFASLLHFTLDLSQHEGEKSTYCHKTYIASEKIIQCLYLWFSSVLPHCRSPVRHNNSGRCHIWHQKSTILKWIDPIAFSRISKLLQVSLRAPTPDICPLKRLWHIRQRKQMWCGFLSSLTTLIFTLASVSSNFHHCVCEQNIIKYQQFFMQYDLIIHSETDFF